MKILTAIKLFIYKWFVHGKLNPIGKLLYDIIIAQELTVQQMIDYYYPLPSTNDSTLLKDITVIIKTFERPITLRRLIKSIKRKYPDIHIIVVDDSRNSVQLDGVQMIIMPYNSGISAGRNEALRYITTKYFLLLDDDFVFYRHTKLEAALVLMENFSPIDIMGGEVVNLPFFNTLDYSKAPLFPTKATATMPLGSVISGLPVYDKVSNFFIGRTERVRTVGWDPQLKKIEHADFFTRAKGILTTVYNINLKCLHARTPFDTAYMIKRNDIALEKMILWNRYYRKE